MSKVDNPRAFPRVNGFVDSPGMTLRDWFAGQALATAAAYPAEDLSTWFAKDFAAHAYTIADAMLAERAKGGEA